MAWWVALAVSAATLLVATVPVLAGDGVRVGAHVDGLLGTGGPGGDDGSTGDNGGGGGGDDGGAPLACNGSLCDTTNGSQCDVARSSVGVAQVNALSSILIGGLALAVILRVRGRPRRGTLCPRPRRPAR